MALYAMSDLHLSLSAEKPMDIFGSAWHNYMEKIDANWRSLITDDDLVIVGGDISWAMYIEEANKDFEFLNLLPGKKLLVRGNHDYWWTSYSKLRQYVASNGFDTISFLQNDSFVYENTVISGTRGWLIPSSESFGSKDSGIYERELIRLELSLKSAVSNSDEGMRRIAVLHYPPISSEGVPDEKISELLRRYGVTKCVYGHLHGYACSESFSGVADGIEYALVSADHLQFNPYNLDS